MRHIILHQDYGTGWSTEYGYNNYDIKRFVLEYRPIIDALIDLQVLDEMIEKVEDKAYMDDGCFIGLTDKQAFELEELRKRRETKRLSASHPAILEFIKDMKEIFNEEIRFRPDRFSELTLETVNYGVKIVNHDGYERIDECSEEWV